jgi:hypothetical protein
LQRTGAVSEPPFAFPENVSACGGSELNLAGASLRAKFTQKVFGRDETSGFNVAF